MKSIIFTDTVGVPREFAPTPANKCIPDWYKHLESYSNNEKKPVNNGNTSATIKKCVPVFDAITSGYIIYSYVDVYVSQKETESNEKQPYYEWPSYEPIQFHPISQAPSHPHNNGHKEAYPKWINPWGIKTPNGYSTLFIQPVHRQSVFTILPGIVDTDTYSSAVNFPFVLNNVTYEGLIPAGTPIAQVIPFKREEWKMSIGNEEEIKEDIKISRLLRTSFFDSYKNKFWHRKEYR